MGHLLDVSELTKKFGGLTAVSNVSFGLKKGEIFGIIGPNGAGKTTLFNVIAGHYRPTSGKVVFEGKDITSRSSNRIAQAGIARTFQSVHLFKQSTMRENLSRAERISRLHSPFAIFSRQPAPEASIIKDVAAFIGMESLLDSVAGDLSYGHQKMIGVGMAMMVSPKLILMDEPAAGLNPTEKREAQKLVKQLRDERKISVLIVEHDMPLVMQVCDRVLVVNQGKPIALGTPEEIRSDPAVIDAYLGEDYEFA